MIESFGHQEFKELIKRSRDSPRKRALMPFQKEDYSGPQVGLNIIQPGSYIPPHFRYQDESIIHYSGKLCDIIFNNEGRIAEKIILGKGAESYLWLPKETFHTLISFEPDSAIWFIVQGPHNPDRFSKVAPWAPKENTPEAKRYLNSLQSITKMK